MATCHVLKLERCRLLRYDIRRRRLWSLYGSQAVIDVVVPPSWWHAVVAPTVVVSASRRAVATCRASAGAAAAAAAAAAAVVVGVWRVLYCVTTVESLWSYWPRQRCWSEPGQASPAVACVVRPGRPMLTVWTTHCWIRSVPQPPASSVAPAHRHRSIYGGPKNWQHFCTP